MKSEKQVLRQLSGLKFSADDWAQVSKFLKKTGIKAVRRSMGGGGVSCGYEEFLDWYKNGAAVGDIVGCGRSAVIVSFAFKGVVEYCGYFGLRGELCGTKDGIPQKAADGACDNIELSAEETERYRRNYLTSGYVVDEEKGVLTPKKKFETGKVYEFFYGNRVLVGHLRKTRYGNAIFKYGCNEDVLIANEVTVECHNVMRLLDDAETENFYEMMRAQYARCWDDTRKELMVLAQRQDKGKPYFFITENFTVSGANDWRTSRTNRHYWSGNYFATKEEAASFLEMVNRERTERIKSQLLSQATGNANLLK